MIRKIRSVALSGLLILFGGIGAEASPFSIHFDLNTGADGGASFTLTGDTTQSKASFSYYENDQASDFVNFISTSFTDPLASFTRSGYASGPDGFGTTNSISFNVFDPNYSYVVANTDGSSQTKEGFSLAFTLLQRVAPDGAVYGYNTVFASPTLLGSAFESANSSGIVTGNPLSTVPLPSSVPMFGAALVGLAGLGYAAKRKKVAMAA